MQKPLRVLATLAGLALLGGCEGTNDYKLPHQVDSFRVVIEEVQPTNPPDQTGETPEKALPIPLDPITVRVTVTAIDENGAVLTGFDRPVSFRAVPGNVLAATDLDGNVWADRMLKMVNGVATGWVTVDKVFGEFRLWAQDSAPDPVYQLPADGMDGGTPVDAGTTAPQYVEVDGSRTFAGGVSGPVYFVKPTIADIQLVPTDPPGCPGGSCKVDTRLSPFVTNFLTIDAPYPRGDMIVTSITNEGFYVTDMLAERVARAPYENAVGTFGHLFVYNYSYPDGLLVGDRVSSLTGTVQEFSGATQLVFPSWVRVEGQPKPEDLPAPLELSFTDWASNPPSVGYRVCKTGTRYEPQVNPANNLDLLCGYSTNNVDIESIESSLVKLVNAKPSNVFADCDTNGNSNIGLFGQTKYEDGTWGWACFEEGADKDDCQCYLDCVIGGGQFKDKLCTELNSLETYGQWLVQLEDRWGVRINVATRDALPELDPRDFAKPEHAGCTVDLVGIIRQTQAARPRWIVIARDEDDVCCHPPADSEKSCPTGIKVCAADQ